jgi:DNA-binding transcriptional LysR family regulator
MTDLKSYAVFAETVAAGSMSAAARRLHMTPSAVSQIIRGLERQTGITLLNRSTRKLTLTEAGGRCYPHCVQMVEAARAASASLEQARDAPSGELRISAPVGFGAHVAPALAPVLAEWPQLRLSLIVDDTLIDLIDQRIDIALRVGSLADSTWVGRKLGDLHSILCASPSYLERHGSPASEEELKHHQWLALSRDIVDSASGDRMISIFGNQRETAGSDELVVPVRIITTNQIALQQMCEQGMGIARLFYADARPALERGTLVRILAQSEFPARPVTMLTLGRGEEAAKVRVALSALKKYFAALVV